MSSGMLTSAAPPLKSTWRTVDVSESELSVSCGVAPPLNVAKRRGSWIQFPPALKSWPMPPMPVMLHEKSSRNCHFVCSVACGVLGLAPERTPFGKSSHGSLLLSGMAFLKSAYWTTTSFSFEPPLTQLWLTLNELNSARVAIRTYAISAQRVDGDEYEVSRVLRASRRVRLR